MLLIDNKDSALVSNTVMVDWALEIVVSVSSVYFKTF